MQLLLIKLPRICLTKTDDLFEIGEQVAFEGEVEVIIDPDEAADETWIDLSLVFEGQQVGCGFLFFLAGMTCFLIFHSL